MYILESEPKAVNYATSTISQIEDKIKNNESVTEDEVNILLEYICYRTRVTLSDDWYKDTFKGKDLDAASILHNYFTDLNVESQVINTRESIDYGVLNNNFVVAKIKTNLYGENMYLYYLLDPTFKQFCTFERCKPSDIKEKNGIIYEKPEIPYYISSFDAEFVADFLYLGYMFLDSDAAEVYGNAFLNTKVPVKAKNKGESSLLTGEEYITRFTQKYDTKFYTKEELEEKGLLVEPIKSNVMKLENHN